MIGEYNNIIVKELAPLLLGYPASFLQQVEIWVSNRNFLELRRKKVSQVHPELNLFMLETPVEIY